MSYESKLITAVIMLGIAAWFCALLKFDKIFPDKPEEQPPRGSADDDHQF